MGSKVESAAQNKFKREASQGQPAEKAVVKQPSARELAKSWASYEPTVPLSFVIAARKAAKEKNS